MLPILRNASWLLLKGFVYAVIILGLTWCVYVTIVRPHTKPNPTTTEQAEEILHNNPKVYFGCLNFAIPKK